jgi:hypothetical protein
LAFGRVAKKKGEENGVLGPFAQISFEFQNNSNVAPMVV